MCVESSIYSARASISVSHYKLGARRSTAPLPSTFHWFTPASAPHNTPEELHGCRRRPAAPRAAWQETVNVEKRGRTQQSVYSEALNNPDSQKSALNLSQSGRAPEYIQSEQERERECESKPELSEACVHQLIHWIHKSSTGDSLVSSSGRTNCS